MAKVTMTPTTVVSAFALLISAIAAIGCGGASGGTRATGGATGSGGHLGTAGNTGTGGNGSAGATGTGGAVPTCSYPTLTGALDCTNGVSPSAPLLSDWSPTTWANTQGKWHTVACDLTGSVFAGAKPAARGGGGVVDDRCPQRPGYQPQLRAQGDGAVG